MARKLLFLISISTLVLCGAAANAAQKNVGSTIKVPQGANVQMQGKNGVTIKSINGLGISGTFDCSCSKGGGNCEVVSSVSGVLVCRDGTPKCSGGCSFTTTTTGAQ